jgi:hypothetical protein
VAGLDLPPRLFSQGKAQRPVKYRGPESWQPVVLAALSAARQGDRAAAAEAFAFVEALPDSVKVNHRAVDGVLVSLARLAAVLGDRDRAVAYIRQRNELAGGRLSRHFHHRDFESLVGYVPWERVTSPAR